MYIPGMDALEKLKKGTLDSGAAAGKAATKMFKGVLNAQKKAVSKKIKATKKEIKSLKADLELLLKLQRGFARDGARDGMSGGAGAALGLLPRIYQAEREVDAKKSELAELEKYQKSLDKISP